MLEVFDVDFLGFKIRSDVDILGFKISFDVDIFLIQKIIVMYCGDKFGNFHKQLMTFSSKHLFTLAPSSLISDIKSLIKSYC